MEARHPARGRRRPPPAARPDMPDARPQRALPGVLQPADDLSSLGRGRRDAVSVGLCARALSHRRRSQKPPRRGRADRGMSMRDSANSALAMDASFASGYLAAMIDGEGHVAIQRRGRTIVSRSVIITNTDHGIIEATVEACRALGIRALVRDKHVRPGRRPCKRVVISRRENLERLYEVVALRSEVKAARLAEA